MARFANAMYHGTGDARARAATEQTMHYLVTSDSPATPFGGELLAVYKTTHSVPQEAVLAWVK